MVQRRRRCEPVLHDRRPAEQETSLARPRANLELDDRGAAADVLERNQRETVRLQHKLAYASVGSEKPDRVA